MWMDIVVAIMAVAAFGAGALCFFEGFKNHNDKSKG